MARIMVVEDDRDLANLTRLTLIKNGYDVSVFHEASQALEEAKNKKPDLILMDIMLPKVGGGEAVKRMKKNPQLANVPVVFLTGLISNEEGELEESGISIDGVNYKTLGKPYEIDQLLKLVKNILGNRNV